MRNMESEEWDMSPEEEARWRQNERHGQLLAQRLSRLVERGYRPVFVGETDTFDLVHPSTKATQVQLWPDGQVVDRYPTMIEDGERTIIYPEDEARFARFLASAPQLGATRRFLGMRVGDALVYMMVWSGLIVFALVGSALWRLFFGDWGPSGCAYPIQGAALAPQSASPTHEPLAPSPRPWSKRSETCSGRYVH